MSEKIKKIRKLIFYPNINSVFLCYLAIRLAESNKKFLSIRVKNCLIKKYGIHLGLSSNIGLNIKFPHPQGIIIGEKVKIGNDCVLYHQVTLGKKYGDLNSEEDYPVIGDNVIIFPGAKIIGGVKIGDGAIIAANSVVLKDVEANSTYAGIPAKKIK